uniref:Uncharacterized protein n=1 Tax=Anguilla anguilla TaxID=7936 RepID=A0A0E9P894_ANGAN
MANAWARRTENSYRAGKSYLVLSVKPLFVCRSLGLRKRRP